MTRFSRFRWQPSGNTDCSLLAPHTKYGIRASCILCWLMLVCAAVIYTHAEAFLRQTQNSLTFFWSTSNLRTLSYWVWFGYSKKFCLTTSKAKTSPMFPLISATAQYHQIICAVKSDSRTLATFQNVGNKRKQGGVIWNKCVGPTLFVFSHDFMLILNSNNSRNL